MLSLAERFNKRLQRNWNRIVYYAWVLEEVQIGLKGPWGEVKAGCGQRALQDLGYMFLLGSTSGVLWGSRLRLGQSIQTKKSRILVSFSGVLPKRSTRGKPWKAGENTHYKGHWGNCTSNLHLLITLQAVICGMCFGEGQVSVQGPCRSLGHAEWMPRQGCYAIVQLNP